MPKVIASRHDGVSYFVSDRRVSRRPADVSAQCPDIERALSRLALDRGGPRDLAALRNGLAQAAAIADLLLAGDLPDAPAPHARADCRARVAARSLDAALVAEPPLLARDGGFIAPGHDADLDAARTLRDEGRGVIAKMQADYRQETGVQSLKIKHNNVLGYFIETTATHAQKMLSPPLSERFIHRQTTANAVRFTTLDLSELETRILNAGSRALEIEMALFAAARRGPGRGDRIGAGRAALAELDVQSALATRAPRATGAARDRRRAALSSWPDGIRWWKAALARTGAPFIANDCALDRRGRERRDHAADRAEHGR
jgi:DNA mismatch repair protein MutS